MYKLVVFVDEQHLEQVKLAMFQAGAGKIGNYDCCCFVSEGMGEFRPLAGSNPFLGKVNQVERVKELKLEMVCEDQLIRPVLEAMRSAHPYETPAFDVIQLADLNF